MFNSAENAIFENPRDISDEIEETPLMFFNEIRLSNIKGALSDLRQFLATENP